MGIIYKQKSNANFKKILNGIERINIFIMNMARKKNCISVGQRKQNTFRHNSQKGIYEIKISKEVATLSEGNFCHTKKVFSLAHPIYRWVYLPFECIELILPIKKI